MEESKNEMVNPLDYVYDDDQVVGINGNALLSIMNLLYQVVEEQPKVATLLQYPKSVNEMRDEKGELLKVDIQWEDHTPNSFFFTAADDNGGVPVMTELAFKSQQIIYGLSKMHEKNINSNIAKKKTDLDAKKAFE